MNVNRDITIIVGAAALVTAAYMLFRNKQTNPTTNNMNNKNLPRGYRNNNPLNIEKSSETWLGKIVPSTDPRFEQFKSIEYGYRAALANIRTYINKYGLNTVAEIINRWAPASDGNNTSGYIQRVCSTTGFMPGTTIIATDRDQMCKLVYAMAIVENGNTPMPSYDQIYAGWNLL